MAASVCYRAVEPVRDRVGGRSSRPGGLAAFSLVSRYRTMTHDPSLPSFLPPIFPHPYSPSSFLSQPNIPQHLSTSFSTTHDNNRQLTTTTLTSLNSLPMSSANVKTHSSRQFDSSASFSSLLTSSVCFLLFLVLWHPSIQRPTSSVFRPTSSCILVQHPRPSSSCIARLCQIDSLVVEHTTGGWNSLLPVWFGLDFVLCCRTGHLLLLSRRGGDLRVVA